MGELFIIYGNQVESMVRQLVERTGALDRLRPDDTVMRQKVGQLARWP